MWEITQALIFGSSFFLFGVTVWQKARWLFFTPTNEADWTKDQTLLQTAVFNTDGTVTIKNLRDITYRTEEDFDVAHTEQIFRLGDAHTVWAVHSLFGVGAAHFFFSFEFSDGTYLPISIEIRKRVGASFGWKVLFKPFELMYIAATEADVVRTRLCDRKEEQVFVYKMNIPTDVIPALLRDMLERMNQLAEKPHFYNILAENCTSLPVWHLKRVWRSCPLPWWDWRYFVSSRIDELLRARKLIDIPLSLEGKDLCAAPRAEFSKILRG